MAMYMPSQEATTHFNTRNTIGVFGCYHARSTKELDYVDEVLHSIIITASEFGQHTLVYSPHLTLSDSYYRCLDMIKDGRCDGYLLMASTYPHEVITHLVTEQIPFVMIGIQSDDAFCPCVDVDNYNAGRSVIDYLMALGHRKIGFIYPTLQYRFSTDRYRAYCDCLTEAGLPLRDEYLAETSFGNRQMYDTAYSYLTRNKEDLPTAIFAANDAIGLSIIKAAHDLGIAIPHDISVIGFDDISQAHRADPPLTTMRQPKAAIGARSVLMLLDRVRRPGSAAESSNVPAELIIRASTGRPKC